MFFINGTRCCVLLVVVHDAQGTLLEKAQQLTIACSLGADLATGFLYSRFQILSFQSVRLNSDTTLQPMKNVKLCQHRFWPCHENGLIKDDSNNTPQPLCEFQVGFPLLWIEARPGLS